MADSFGQTGDCIGLRWDSTPQEKAAWLRQAGIQTLNARPSDFRQIVQAMTEKDALRYRLKGAMMLGEPIDAGLRARISGTTW